MKKVNCKHWTDCQLKNGGCCLKDHYGGKPSLGVCEKICEYRDPEIKDGPPLLQKIKAFTREIGKTIKNLTHGEVSFVSEKIRKERYDICQDCSFLNENGSCLECGCNMAIKCKLKDVKCPIDKW